MIKYVCNNCDNLICESSTCPVCNNRTFIDKSDTLTLTNEKLG